MNGVHDMGGMQGFGPIRPEKTEPVFHARWEGRLQAIWSALGTWRKWNGDFGRQSREFLPPADYLALTYYQLRYAQVVELLAASGMATRAEIDSGRAAKGTQKGPAAHRRQSRGLVCKWQPQETRRCGRSEIPSGPARAGPQHQSSDPHAPASLCTWQGRHHRA